MKEKERMLDKKISNLKSKKTAKKKSLQEKGITLIALVVTIIILLILAGVTLNIALSDGGLFSKTQEAADKYKYAQNDEEEMIRQIATQMYSEYVGAEVTGYTPQPWNEYKDGYKISSELSGLTQNTDNNKKVIGGVDPSTFEQTFTIDTTIKWRIWDFDGTTLRIIADPTKDTLALEGATGYNNGVYLINDICRELYGQHNEDGSMKKGIEASNLRRSDIEAVSSYDYKKYEHYKGEFTTDEENIDRNYTTQFGEKCKSEKNVTCPAIWTEVDSKWKYEYDDEKGQSGINNEKETWESEGTSEIRKKESTTVKSTDIELKESMYYHRYEKDEFSEDYFDLIFGDFSQYWLNSRSVAFDRNMDAFRYKLYCSVVKKIQL